MLHLCVACLVDSVWSPGFVWDWLGFLVVFGFDKGCGEFTEVWIGGVLFWDLGDLFDGFCYFGSSA